MVGVINGRRSACTALQPHCRRPLRAVACIMRRSPSPRRAGRRRHAVSGSLPMSAPPKPPILLIIELIVLGVVVVAVAYLVATL